MLWELLTNHPWGQPTEYFFDVMHIAEGVKQNSRTKCSVGPDWDTPCSIILLSFDTGRLVSTKEYVELYEIPVTGHNKILASSY